MELQSRIRVVRESIATITQILAERDIPVHQRGTEACVRFDSYTGEPKCVMLPYLPDNASEKLIAAVQGFLDHEVGHLLFTDRKVITSISHDPQLLQMHNVFEDPFVERKMRLRFRGSKDNFNSLFDFFINDIVDPNYRSLTDKEEVNPTAYFGALLPCIVRAWANVDTFQHYMKDKWHHVQPIVDKIPQTLIDRVAVTDSTQDNLDIARDVLEAILHVEDELSDDEESPELDDDRDRSDGDSDGDDADGDDDDGDASGESDVDDSSSGKEDWRDSDEMERESSEADYVPDMPDMKEETGSEEEGEQSDVTDDDDKSGESESHEPSESSESLGSGEEEIIEDEEEIIEDEEDAEEDTPYEVDKDELADAMMGDLEEAIAPKISELTEKSLMDADYKVPTEDYDVIEEAPIARTCYDVREFDNKTLEVASVMQGDFEAAFVSQQRSYWRGSQYSGRINPSQLARLKVGDPRVFRKKEVHKTQDYDVQLVIDCSGSMQGSRIELACQAAYAMAQVLDRINVNFEVIGYTTVDDFSLLRLVDSGIAYSRYDAIRMVVFKSFEESMSPIVAERLASWSEIREYGELCENVDGESMLIAARRLMAQPSSGKAMIALSDGSPACSSRDHASLTRHLIQANQLIEDEGIKLFGIGIQHDNIEHYFRNSTCIHNLSELPKAVIDKLMNIMLNQ